MRQRTRRRFILISCDEAAIGGDGLDALAWRWTRTGGAELSRSVGRTASKCPPSWWSTWYVISEVPSLPRGWRQQSEHPAILARRDCPPASAQTPEPTSPWRGSGANGARQGRAELAAHGPSSGLVKICSRPRTNALTLWIARQAAHGPLRADRVLNANHVLVVLVNAVHSGKKRSVADCGGRNRGLRFRTGAFGRETAAREPELR